MRNSSPTMSDIARLAGVSKNTVSLALRSDPQIPESTRSRIRRIARRLGYRKNPTVAHLMVQLRIGRSPRFQPSLAMLNANLDHRAFTRHPTVPVYVEGCRRRATELGYSLDEFWLHDPELDGKRLNRILKARNIRGLIVIGLMSENVLPKRFLPTWKEFPTVVTGVRTKNPALSFACVDHHMLVLTAFQKALALGYQRPALAIDSRIDHLVEGRFTAGFFVAQQRIAPSQRTRPFSFIPEAKESPTEFRAWLKQEKPDAILTLYRVVQRWMENAGREVPRDIGLIQLERRPGQDDWSGMNQHNDLIGEAAVEMVINMIHNNQAGIPAFPRATLVSGTWVDGRSRHLAGSGEKTAR